MHAKSPGVLASAGRGVPLGVPSATREIEETISGTQRHPQQAGAPRVSGHHYNESKHLTLVIVHQTF
jgi:hypothetical protein